MTPTKSAKSNGFRCVDGCHECCTCPPLKKSFLLKYQYLVKGKNIQVIEEMGYCFVLTKDYMCPFLQDGKCVVYSVRPRYCRRYGLTDEMPCVYVDKKGKERTPVEQQRIRNEWAEKRLKVQLAFK